MSWRRSKRHHLTSQFRFMAYPRVWRKGRIFRPAQRYLVLRKGLSHKLMSHGENKESDCVFSAAARSVGGFFSFNRQWQTLDKWLKACRWFFTLFARLGLCSVFRKQNPPSWVFKQAKMLRNYDSNTPSPIFNGCPNCGLCSSPPLVNLALWQN